MLLLVTNLANARANHETPLASLTGGAELS